ncbi:MAG: hypothetical protein EBX50_13990 [Chitinophagia bacterium]|nr:hypothetical protein [Chitinophagia bacterium]
MKKVFIVITCFFISFSVIAQTKKNGTPDMRYKSNKQTYSNSSSSSYSTLRPIYSGQTHTTSHGGSYPGSVNSHHKGGHYINPTSNNNYGIHKKKPN